MPIRLTVEGIAGDTIEGDSEDLQRLADQLGITVEMKFNDVQLWAYPGGTFQALVDGYRRATKLPKGHFRFAASR